MNSNDLEYLAKFVAQRMEIGETEWFFKPEILYADLKKHSDGNSEKTSFPVSDITFQTSEQKIFKKE